MRLKWMERAREDLIAIAEHIAESSPAAARSTVDRLRAQGRRACEFPRAGRVVPEFGQDDIREFIVGNYRLVYRVVPGEVHVLTVFEGHRLLRLDDPKAGPGDRGRR